MGKTVRNVSASSRSVSYKTDHHRGFVKVKDRRSHHSNRNENKNADEISFQNFNCKIKFGREDFFGMYYEQQSSIPNMHDHYIIGMYLTDNDNPEYLDATSKQIKRRGKIGCFVGHNRVNKQ